MVFDQHVDERDDQESGHDRIANRAVLVTAVLDGELEGFGKEQPEQQTEEYTGGDCDLLLVLFGHVPNHYLTGLQLPLLLRVLASF